MPFLSTSVSTRKKAMLIHADVMHIRANPCRREPVEILVEANLDFRPSKIDWHGLAGRGRDGVKSGKTTSTIKFA
jgi:hypothetical protein